MIKYLFLYIICFLGSFLVYSNPDDSTKTVLSKRNKKNPDTLKIYLWKLNESIDTLGMLIDTFLFDFQRFHPATSISISNSIIANNGQATLSNIFDYNNSLSKVPIFIKSFWPYLIDISDIIYYNTKSPYTIGFYTNGKKKDQNLRILHTQNITRNLNFGFIYALASNEGLFKRQKVRDNSAAFFTSYTNKKYSLHACITWNKLRTMTNGGIMADSLFDKTTEPTPTLEVNLSNAETNIDKKSYFIAQKLNLFKYDIHEDSSKVQNYKYISSLSHSLTYEKSAKTYIDQKSQYYENWLVDPNLTKDSIYLRDITNSLFYKINDSIFKNIPIGFRTGIAYQISKYGCFSYDTIYDNTFLHTAFFNETNKYINFEASLKYYIAGYQKSDFVASVNIRKYFNTASDSSWISLSAYANSIKPEWYYNRFSANNFRWENKFRNTEANNIKIEFFSKKFKIRTTVSYYILDNYIFFDTLALPRQSLKRSNVISGYLNKNFIFWKIHLDNYFIYQKASDKNIRIPDLIVYNSIYIRIFPFQKKLPTHIGFDVFYNTFYYGYAYMPATNVFYPENTRKFGGHPYVDFFISAQRKKVRLFFKAEHISAFLVKRNYYTVLHDPANGFGIRFGVSWRFSD